MRCRMLVRNQVLLFPAAVKLAVFKQHPYRKNCFWKMLPVASSIAFGSTSKYVRSISICLISLRTLCEHGRSRAKD